MKSLRALLMGILGVAQMLTLTACGDDPPTNHSPVAVAGPDQTVSTGASVTIDGSASTDPDGDPLTYAWSLDYRPADSTAELSSATAVTPSLTPDTDGGYVLKLVVNDGSADSAPAYVTVTASSTNSNAAPVADAGPDQDAATGAPVTLDGNASADPDGDPLVYAWTLISHPSGSGATLSDPTLVEPEFTPDVDGAYVFGLVVSDGALVSASAYVTVTADNTAPVADAGPDQHVTTGTLVTLDASASADADNDPLTYSWTLISQPSGSAATLPDPTLLAPSFLTDVDGAYVFGLVVNDGSSDSAPVYTTVTAATTNTRPVANAGADRLVSVSWPWRLDGSGSADGDGDPLTYSWSLVYRPPGSGAVLLDAALPSAGLTPDLEGTYLAQLVVNDGNIDSAPDLVTVTVLPAGALDTHFGTGGSTATDISSSDRLTALALDPLDRIVVVGASSSNFDDFAVVRYQQDGTADPSFGTGGVVETDITGAASWDNARAVAVLPDGRIVAAGDCYDGVSVDIALVRYNPDGTLDTTLGGTGVIKTDIAGAGDTAYAVALQSDGKILVAGASNGDFAVLRYQQDGALDSSFGTGGLVTTDISGNDRVQAMAIDAAGNIVVVGSTGVGLALARYSADGSLDTGFANSGIAQASNIDAEALLLQPDGRIVLAGRVSGSTDFAVLRYAPGGTPDATFGAGGLVTTDLMGTDARARCVALQSDGKILAAGFVSDGVQVDFALVRYHPTGALDSDFGSGGVVTTDIRGQDIARGVAIQSDGRIVVAGNSSGAPAGYTVARYLP